MHTLLLGLGFHPDIRTGDKSFWLDALPFLAERHERISIVSSVHGCDTRLEETTQLGNCSVHCVYLPAVRMVAAGSRRRNALHVLQNVVGKAIASRRLAREAKRVMRDAVRFGIPVGTVHLMDNLGPWMSGAMTRCASAVSISAVSFMGHESRLYRRYLKASYGSRDIHVVPYSLAFAKRLASLGIDKSHIHTIKWGVNVPVGPVSAQERMAAKEKLGIPVHHTLVLWAGYIQQVGHAELLVSHELARTVAARRDDVHFFFALKPECFGDGSDMPASVPGSITVTGTRSAEFQTVLNASDYLLSFTTKRSAILAPPLTWFEAMGRGMPIVTVAAAGVEEVIAPDDAGFVAADAQDLLPWLRQAKQLSDSALVRCNARAHEVGSVRTSAYRLCDLWSRLAVDRIGS